MISAPKALQRFRGGNRRFVSGITTRAASLRQTRRIELATEQHPFASDLACSDGCVPAEYSPESGVVAFLDGREPDWQHVDTVRFAIALFRRAGDRVRMSANGPGDPPPHQ